MFLINFLLSTVFFEERFNSGWEDRWSKPSHVRKGVTLGRVRVTAGYFYGDEKIQRGLETMDSRRHYAIYSNFTHRMDTRDKDLIVQYTVRLPFDLDCSSNYLKLMSSDVDPSYFSNETEYSLMFGPDVCNPVLRKTQFILDYKGKKHPTKKPLNCIKDHLTHAYTLIIRKNNKIVVKIDGEAIDNADMDDRFDIPDVSEIPDPSDKKPDNWEDDEWIVDPQDRKPDDWVDDEFIFDPDAFKPPSWDDSILWQPPTIRNPHFKGQWKPKIIKNPNYKGVWYPRKINQTAKDPDFGHFSSLSYLGLEMFHNAPGAIFDNFLVTDDESYANQMLHDVFLSVRDLEVKNFDAQNERRIKERELDELKRDKESHMDRDYEKITDTTDSDRNYFNVRQKIAKKKKNKKPSQFVNL